MSVATASAPLNTFQGPRRAGNSLDRRRTGKFPEKGKGESPTRKEHDILFQKFFKSVGPRTYAAQVKRASNGNHYLVLMEGKRDEKSAEVRKMRLFVYSEDFVEFFRLVKSAAEFIKANPLPPEVQAKRQAFWAKQSVKPAVDGSPTPNGSLPPSRSR